MDGARPCRSVCRSERIRGRRDAVRREVPRQRAVGVDEPQRPDRVRGVERLGLGQVLGHVSLDELDTFNVRVGGDGAFVLGRGQLDAGDAGAVRLGEMDGVVAGAGDDFQDVAAGDVTEDFSFRPDPFPRTSRTAGRGWTV